MVFSPSGNRISFRLPQPQKAESPMASGIGQGHFLQPEQILKQTVGNAAGPGQEHRLFHQAAAHLAGKGPSDIGLRLAVQLHLPEHRAVQAPSPSRSTVLGSVAFWNSLSIKASSASSVTGRPATVSGMARVVYSSRRAAGESHAAAVQNLVGPVAVLGRRGRLPGGSPPSAS